MPERDGMDWDEAIDIAVTWVRAECVAQGRRGVLVTVSKNSLGGGPLEAFARAGDWITPRSGRAGVDIGRPVLAYVPDEQALQLATRYARGSSLCAVEGFGTSLSGWARSIGALNLLGEGPGPELDARLLEALDHLHFVGNNGWGDGFGQHRAQGTLLGLREQGLLDQDAIVGDMLARGHSPRSVKQLTALIDKLNRGDLRPPRRRY
ncbi:hypothetical protein F1C76_15080 [Geodermatophilaceae bacterium NBWT11]|nr:hypothetical protein F1C76_15080 [Geodermatophilaceae bacterium NBWT11]